MKGRAAGLAVLISLSPLAAAHAEDPSVMLVLDGSGSMWGRVDGTAKIEIARAMLSEMLSELSPGAEVGLAAYGHRREGDCDDIEVLLPVGHHPPELLAARIAGVQPRGKTPIMAALQLVADEVGDGSAPTDLVLVSDGEETCGGDPCALVRTLRDRGMRLTFHVVGFDVGAEERAQLECIAAEGGGLYADARTAEELGRALGEIRKSVEDTAEPPLDYVPLDTGWRVHDYQVEGADIRQTSAYTFSDNGRVAVQQANPMPSVYYRVEPLPEGVEVTGRFGVRTTTDDDLIGFVFGWQDPGHYYLFEWKQAWQHSGRCGKALEGAWLKLVSNEDEPFDCRDFWTPEGTDRARSLVDAESNPNGWKDGTDYTFRLVFRPGDIVVEVYEGDETVVRMTSSDSTYRSGSFGFFNYSQPSVRYDSFRFEPLD